MKKNTVSIDFIVFGDLEPENTRKLEIFNEHIKSTDGSHLAIIPPGPNLLSDVLMTTDVLAGYGVGPRGDGGVDGGGETGDSGFEFDVDPSMDPELALALRMSMEEEKARQEQEAKAKEASKEPTLQRIPEEGGESQPLLNAEGEASRSGEARSSDNKEEQKKEEGGGDVEKMDTS